MGVSYEIVSEMAREKKKTFRKMRNYQKMLYIKAYAVVGPSACDGA